MNKYEQAVPEARTEGAKMVGLLRRFSFWGLSWSDGCLCGRIEAFSIRVDVSCRKSSRSFYGNVVRVTSSYCSKEELQPVASEMVRQLREVDGHLDIRVAFRERGHDEKCLYCPGDVQTGIALCSKCAAKEDSVRMYGGLDTVVYPAMADKSADGTGEPE